MRSRCGRASRRAARCRAPADDLEVFAETTRRRPYLARSRRAGEAEAHLALPEGRALGRSPRMVVAPRKRCSAACRLIGVVEPEMGKGSASAGSCPGPAPCVGAPGRSVALGRLPPARAFRSAKCGRAPLLSSANRLVELGGEITTAGGRGGRSARQESRGLRRAVEDAANAERAPPVSSCATAEQGRKRGPARRLADAEKSAAQSRCAAQPRSVKNDTRLAREIESAESRLAEAKRAFGRCFPRPTPKLAGGAERRARGHSSRAPRRVGEPRRPTICSKREATLAGEPAGGRLARDPLRAGPSVTVRPARQIETLENPPRPDGGARHDATAGASRARSLLSAIVFSAPSERAEGAPQKNAGRCAGRKAENRTQGRPPVTPGPAEACR